MSVEQSRRSVYASAGDDGIGQYVDVGLHKPLARRLDLVCRPLQMTRAMLVEHLLTMALEMVESEPALLDGLCRRCSWMPDRRRKR